MFFRRQKKKNIYGLAPDEIFLDSQNLPEFDRNQFEGRLERPIPKRSIVLLGIFLAAIGFIFLFRLADLQVAEGEEYRALSENNRLRHTPIFSERGVLYDRNKELMAWNTKNSEDEYSSRSYIQDAGFSHLLGYVSYPKKDSAGFYFREDIEGKDGIEFFYNYILSGESGLKITEVDVFSNIRSESIISPPKDGENITLSIDSRLQKKLYEYIKDLANQVGFSGGAGVIIDIDNGEVLAISSFPEYDSEVMSEGKESEKIASFVSDKNNPFLNRAVSGLYTPGSTVKLFLGSGALNEGIIDPLKNIYSSGEISVQNPYDPDLKTVFKDWKAHGWVDMRKAIAVSSNVYFYAIGGGYEDQKGLGIINIEKYMRMFGFGEETNIDMSGEKNGTIPNPEWKEENFPGDPWRIGDTYHTAIGQYGFQVTPLQLVRAVAAIANGGKLVSPHLLAYREGGSALIEDLKEIKYVDIAPEYLKIIQEGMRMGVLDGTAKGMNIPQVEIAAKTGTAELGVSKSQVNSWVTGFFPYEDPKYAFAVVMERGPRSNTIGSLFVMRQMIEWMSIYTPEYIK